LSMRNSILRRFRLQLYWETASTGRLWRQDRSACPVWAWIDRSWQRWNWIRISFSLTTRSNSTLPVKTRIFEQQYICDAGRLSTGAKWNSGQNSSCVPSNCA
jgi:hypothetical protein